ncbi:hypothetical protein BofuT4_P151540.1 [Botrytis cinerea T4]|uniref:Uncharacterized protein n=1 Tax=Botryotinia fuckeliana (strain T4) TaxID=999810 RepID=G2YWM4_BOTF4|nr:hypothetical protein BofuT4_P151540.1 [Botrytis cinerea T4]
MIIVCFIAHPQIPCLLSLIHRVDQTYTGIIAPRKATELPLEIFDESTRNHLDQLVWRIRIPIHPSNHHVIIPLPFGDVDQIGNGLLTTQYDVQPNTTRMIDERFFCLLRVS